VKIEYKKEGDDKDYVLILKQTDYFKMCLEDYKGENSK